jgi:SAM-dependent methyltransferase/uncharacterized protein YbaR (Trm112 family)
MIFKGIELCCPICKSDLVESGAPEKALVCGPCGRRFPIVLGIPDLRVFADPYIDIEADRAKGLRIAERCDDFDFAGLVDFYYSITPAVPPKHARQYTRGLLAAEARAAAALDAWHSVADDGPPPATLLEIGCGTGPLLVAASKRGPLRLIGIDIAFRWLAVAKKRLAEAGLDLPLICACAEALPFPSGQFDRVVAESAIEHLQDQRQALSEVGRVMRRGGGLFLSTPNRFSLGPDPHVGLWGGGFLPRRFLDLYARQLGAVPPRRHLLSRRALTALLEESGFRRAVVFLPDVSPIQRAQFRPLARTAIDVYHRLKRLPATRPILNLVGPTFFAVCEERS